MKNNRIIYGVWFIILQWLLISCASSEGIMANDMLPGVFVDKNFKGIEFRLEEDKFLLIDTNKNQHLSLYDCCDTIAYGNWKLDERNFLVLNNAIELNRSGLSFPNELKMQVVEKIDYSKDSIYFFVNNPIQDFYLRNKRDKSDIKYFLYVGPNKRKIEFSANKLVLSKDEYTSINDFFIEVLIDCGIYLKNLEVRNIGILPPYKINNSSSNVFMIYIPELTFGFLSYKRLNDDYVKIVNNNKLLWDGKEYIRKR